MAEWRARQPTRWVRASLKDEIENIKNDWVSGSFSDESIEKAGQLNVEAMGRVRGLLFALDFLTVEEEEDEE